MPAVSSGDDYGVDIRSGQKVLKVGIKFGVRVAVVLVNNRFTGIAAALLNVADSHALNVGQREDPLEVVSAAWADTTHAQSDAFTGRSHVGLFAQRPCRDNGRKGHGGTGCGHRI